MISFKLAIKKTKEKQKKTNQIFFDYRYVKFKIRYGLPGGSLF